MAKSIAKNAAKRTPKATPTKPRKKRQRYTAAKQAEVLAAAQKENLTAKQIQQRFGVTPVTYYSWRKKAKLPPMPRGRRPGSGKGTAGRSVAGTALNEASEQQFRGAVRQRVQAIIQDEIRRALAEIR